VISYEQAASQFQAAYGREPEAFAWAPGRVNLIGEHLDYAGGHVLPVSLSLGVTVAAGRGRPGRVRVHSDRYLDAGVAEFDPEAKPPSAYMGFVHALVIESKATGADLAVCADLPVERGWSSSAAFAVALSAALLALEERFLRPTPEELCRMCQRAEERALGVSCGLMDQYVSIYGRATDAVLLDTRLLTHQYVPLALQEVAFIGVDSGQTRKLATSGYNQRRQELAEALAWLERWYERPVELRELDSQELLHLAEQMDYPLGSRLRHIVSEEQRVLRFVEQLQSGAVIELGRLLSASHYSLRDDYQVSTPELDLLCDRLAFAAGIFGARLVGGGFGGNVLALADRDALPNNVEEALGGYRERTGLATQWQEIVAGEGAAVKLMDEPATKLEEWLP